jgi:hypothetical protein
MAVPEKDLPLVHLDARSTGRQLDAFFRGSVYDGGRNLSAGVSRPLAVGARNLQFAWSRSATFSMNQAVSVITRQRFAHA